MESFQRGAFRLVRRPLQQRTTTAIVVFIVVVLFRKDVPKTAGQSNQEHWWHNSTPRHSLTRPGQREYHPLSCPVPRDLARPNNARVSRPQFDTQMGVDSHGELMTLQSPLLGQSWLVSFPPPTDMLKLSGWSCLNSGRTERARVGEWAHSTLSVGTRSCQAQPLDGHVPC